MTILEFDNLYREKGGIAMLIEFTQEGFTTKFIGEHFGVTKDRVSQWCLELFGQQYDPRKDRKEAKIEKMLEFAKTHSEEEFREAYYHVEPYYYNLSLAEAYVRGIYKK